MPSRNTRKNSRKNSRKQRGGNLSAVLPTTSWGSWSAYPGALAWSASTQAPAPLANGGLYSGAQSTGVWASQPMPATQYAFAVEAAKTAGMTDVFYQQRPADNGGASFSPFVGVAASPVHFDATMGPKIGGRSRKHRNRKNKSNKNSRRN